MIREFQGEHRWLSNFAPVSIRFEGRLFPTVENAYVSAKTTSGYNKDLLTTLRPSEAKAFGRTLNIRSDFDTIKFGVMQTLIGLKFYQEPYRSLLLATGDEHIQEGNYWGDKFWGVCLKTNVGANRLGHLIMAYRAALRREI